MFRRIAATAAALGLTATGLTLAHATSPGYLALSLDQAASQVAWQVNSPAIEQAKKSQAWTLTLTAGAGQAIDCASLKTSIGNAQHRQVVQPTKTSCSAAKASVTVTVGNTMVGSAVRFEGRNTTTDASLTAWSDTATWSSPSASRSYEKSVAPTPTPTPTPSSDPTPSEQPSTPPSTDPSTPAPSEAPSTPAPSEPAVTIPPFVPGTGTADVFTYGNWQAPESWMGPDTYVHWIVRSPVITTDMVGREMVYQALPASPGHSFVCGSIGAGYPGANGWTNLSPLCTPDHAYLKVTVTADMVGNQVQLGGNDAVSDYTLDSYSTTVSWAFDGQQTDKVVVVQRGAKA